MIYILCYSINISNGAKIEKKNGKRKTENGKLLFQ